MNRQLPLDIKKRVQYVNESLRVFANNMKNSMRNNVVNKDIQYSDYERGYIKKATDSAVRNIMNSFYSNLNRTGHPRFFLPRLKNETDEAYVERLRSEILKRQKEQRRNTYKTLRFAGIPADQKTLDNISEKVQELDSVMRKNLNTKIKVFLDKVNTFDALHITVRRSPKGNEDRGRIEGGWIVDREATNDMISRGLVVVRKNVVINGKKEILLKQVPLVDLEKFNPKLFKY